MSVLNRYSLWFRMHSKSTYVGTIRRPHCRTFICFHFTCALSTPPAPDLPSAAFTGHPADWNPPWTKVYIIWEMLSNIHFRIFCLSRFVFKLELKKRTSPMWRQICCLSDKCRLRLITGSRTQYTWIRHIKLWSLSTRETLLWLKT
jgi:hypothetical protein